ncbi:MAG: endonuclease domain-containing protein [Gemmataceae bacterium]|nr:endonuclease domain-containing protein [Gemmataceae bacterium]
MRRDEQQQAFARQLRKDQSPAEKIVWKLLRGEQFKPFGFRRQHPIGPYIVDFYSHSTVLVVELDGESHLSPEAQEQDRRRTAFIESLGIHVERFWNPMVFDDSDTVQERIFELCQTRIGMQRKENVIHHVV